MSDSVESTRTAGEQPQSIHASEDARGVFVPMWVIDIVDGDHAAATLLSQLLWWHQPGMDGERRARYERDGHAWLVRADDEWWADARLTLRQVRRIKSDLVKLGLVECRRFKRNGLATSAWRPIPDAVSTAKTSCGADSPVTRTRQSQGSDANASVRSDANTSVPYSLRDLRERSKETSEDLARSPSSRSSQLNIACSTRETESDPKPRKPRVTARTGVKISPTPEAAAAHQMLSEWWLAQSPRPQSSFVGVRTVMSRLLLEGADPQRLRIALDKAPCLTFNALKVAMANGNGHGPPKRRDMVMLDRSGPAASSDPWA